MPPKQVSDESFKALLRAMVVLEQDPDLKRTKREIERLSGLSHDLVARAFRQDAEADGRPWGLNERFERLTSGESGRRSPKDAALAEAEKKLAAERKRNRELEESVDVYATALYAYYLNAQQEAANARPGLDPVPIGRNRRKAQR